MLWICHTARCASPALTQQATATGGGRQLGHVRQKRPIDEGHRTVAGYDAQPAARHLARHPDDLADLQAAHLAQVRPRTAAQIRRLGGAHEAVDRDDLVVDAVYGG